MIRKATASFNLSFQAVSHIIAHGLSWRWSLIQRMFTILLSAGVSVPIAISTGSSQRSLADEPTPGSSPSKPATPSDLRPSDLRPSSEPPNLKQYLNPSRPEDLPGNVITATKISHTGLTIPSLWWVKEEYAATEKFSGKLLENWLAYPIQGNQPGRVDFVVNRQLWSLMDYLDRYIFINSFGIAARDFGYNIRVFDSQETLLAAYTCDFSSLNVSELQRAQIRRRTPSLNNPAASLPCKILLDSSGKAGFRGRPNP